MKSKFQIQIISDIDFEKLIAEISYGGKFIALVNQENGAENLQVQFSDNLKDTFYNFSELLTALKNAKRQLLEEDFDSQKY